MRRREFMTLAAAAAVSPAAAPGIAAGGGASRRTTPMLIATYLVRRAPGMDFAAFRAHSETVHAPLVAKLPGLASYRVAFFPPGAEGDQPYDSAATVGFADRAAHDAALASDAGAVALADLPNFVRPEEVAVLFGEIAIDRSGDRI